LPAGARPSANCAVDEGTLQDCEYLGADGVRYVVFEGQVFRKERDAPFSGGDLPYGLNPAAGPEDAVRTLRRAGLNAGSSTTSEGEVVSAACPGPDPVEVYFRFEERRLRTVGVRGSAV
jgi:hypothetical protein